MLWFPRNSTFSFAWETLFRPSNLFVMVKLLNPKSVPYAVPRFLAILGTSSTFRLVCGPVKEVKKGTVTIYFTPFRSQFQWQFTFRLTSAPNLHNGHGVAMEKQNGGHELEVPGNRFSSSKFQWLDIYFQGCSVQFLFHQWRNYKF